MATIQLTGYRCERCGHEWVPRKGGTPKLCPKCRSAYWDIPKGVGRDGKAVASSGLPKTNDSSDEQELHTS